MKAAAEIPAAPFASSTNFNRRERLSPISGSSGVLDPAFQRHRCYETLPAYDKATAAFARIL
jgi:hypothetical protein